MIWRRRAVVFGSSGSAPRVRGWASALRRMETTPMSAGDYRNTPSHCNATPDVANNPSAGLASDVMASRIIAISLLAAGDIGRVIGWSLVLIALIVVAFLVVIRLRQWLQSDDEPVAAGFSISGLKRLHPEGKISTERVQQARGTMLVAAYAI